MRILLALSGALFLLAGRAGAVVVINPAEDQGNVVMAYEGTIDLEGAELLSRGDSERFGIGVLGGIGHGALISIPFQPLSPTSRPYDTYAGVAFPRFTTDPPRNDGSVDGDVFGVTASGRVLLPEGYRSGSFLSGRIVFFGATFESLGLRPGRWTASVLPGDEQIAFEIFGSRDQIDQPVPLPGAAVFMAAGLAFFARKPVQSFLRR